MNRKRLHIGLVFFRLFSISFSIALAFTQGLLAADDLLSPPTVESRKDLLIREEVISRAVEAHSYSPSQLMTYRGGPVLHGTKTMAIFWGTEWNTASFAKDKITGITDFFDGFGGSAYANVATEYKDKTGYINAHSTHLGTVIDSTAAPTTALTVATAAIEACKITSNAPDPNAVYFIYTSTKPGAVRYCAWHGAGMCSNGAKVQVAYMPNVDAFAYRGCQVSDPTTGHSTGLATLANLTAHELVETITDPRITGWYDIYNQEIGDKCAWVFPSGNGLSTFANGSQWKLQTLWSNNAYKAGSGEPNLSGLKGCLSQ